ncbi:serine hydrolase domain-containing protein [Metabacillus iocasae]|uniref:CubicO group peptidase (Beta-lactamase class C family) n=1 Tax=Priestia iocasae TaxID=2291674 RepID=A0ABS2QT59_9BACI|nr:serine hydrolase domain-containing protein [Metabacillus iocasae]MBM7702147.1 CubicO group peptidase (beta-lactamase class C family) [Metabacillus iocasae]
MKVINIVIVFIYVFFFISPYVIHASTGQEKQLNQYVKHFLKTHHIPGASLALVQNEKVIYTFTSGITGENEREVTMDTPFLIGSISKSFTGLAIMTLVQEGKLKLHDPVQKHLSWFTPRHDGQSQLKVEHLLAHKSGISTYDGLKLADQEDHTTHAIQKKAKKLANIQLTSPPGASYQYSDANYMLLGAIIENLSNQSYAEYMKERIFEPLHMYSAGADQLSVYKNAYQSGYQSWFGYSFKSRVSYDNSGAPYGYIAASANDFIHYLTFLQNPSNDILSTEHMNTFLSPLTQTRQDRHYGLGWMLTDWGENTEMIWHAGSTPDSRSEIFYYPSSRLGGVILTNKNHILEEATLTQFRDGILSIINGEKTKNVTKPFPYIQLSITLIACLLVTLLLYLIVRKLRSPIIQKTKWRRRGLLLIGASIGIIPIFIYSIHTPWHTIVAFAPDLAHLTGIVVILLAINGFVSLYLSFKSYAKGKC